MKKILFKILSFLLSYLLIAIFLYYLFSPIYQANSIIFPFSITPFDIVKSFPKIWIFIKQTYFIFLFFCYLIIFMYLSNTFEKYLVFEKSKNPPQSNNKYKFSKEKFIKNELHLLIGKDERTEMKFIWKKMVYIKICLSQVQLVVGKTSSAMYPFTKQLINYKSDNNDEKIAMLILDVKGNYYKEVLKYANDSNRLEDIILIELGRVL